MNEDIKILSHSTVQIQIHTVSVQVMYDGKQYGGVITLYPDTESWLVCERLIDLPSSLLDKVAQQAWSKVDNFPSKTQYVG